MPRPVGLSASLEHPYLKCKLRSRLGLPFGSSGIAFAFPPYPGFFAGWLIANTRSWPFVIMAEERTLFIHTAFGEQQIQDFVDRVEQVLSVIDLYSELFTRWTQDQPRGPLWVSLGHPNFAHHVFDELTALELLVHRNPLAIGSCLVYRQPVAPLEAIFPELRQQIIHFSKESLKTVITEFFRSGGRTCYLIGNPYTCRLRSRILAACRTVAPLEQTPLIQLLHEGGTKLWVSVKEDNRRCLNLREIVNDLASVIQGLNSKVVLCLDGVSIPYDWRPEYGGAFLKEDNLARIDRTVDEIRMSVRCSLPVINLNRFTLPLALQVAELIDLYICHYGTQQHKVFIGSKAPGIVHGNLSVLKRVARRYVYLWSLGDVNVSLMEANHVRDVDTGAPMQPSFRGSVNLNDYLITDPGKRFLLDVLRSAFRAAH